MTLDASSFVWCEWRMEAMEWNVKWKYFLLFKRGSENGSRWEIGLKIAVGQQKFFGINFHILILFMINLF